MKYKLIIAFLIGLLTGIVGVSIFQNSDKSDSTKNNTVQTSTSPNNDPYIEEGYTTGENLSIDELTDDERVIQYVKTNKALPPYYITKSEARGRGWVASEGNLCDVLPGKAIGGDRFGNREKRLPNNNSYFEADVNYNCGRRNAQRIVFTRDGEVWLTKDHYNTFEKK